MAYVYRHFIPQNTAPPGAKRIVALDTAGREVARIPLGPLTPPSGEPLYRFGIISDLHVHHNPYVSWQPITKLDNALTFFEARGCAFCVACGDLTNTGFYLRTDEAVAGTEYLDEQQFAKYAQIVGGHSIPVYEICGNHESYYGKSITENPGLLETYTGKGVLSYTVEQGGDLFILCGQDAGSSVMSDADYAWLVETLAANPDRRCFLFVHPYIEEDSGDPCDVRENSIFDYWGTVKTNAFMALLRQYPNVVLFHGHSHMKFECQQHDANANYTERNGFKSVHVPSLGIPRDINFDTMKSVDDPEASQGYIADVYDACIVLNGWDFQAGHRIPLGTFRIPAVRG